MLVDIEGVVQDGSGDEKTHTPQPLTVVSSIDLSIKCSIFKANGEGPSAAEFDYFVLAADNNEETDLFTITAKLISDGNTDAPLVVSFFLPMRDTDHIGEGTYAVVGVRSEGTRELIVQPSTITFSSNPATSDDMVVIGYNLDGGGIGQEVVIHGANFVAVDDVLFSGVSADSFSVDSTTQITATIPNTSSGPVEVVSGDVVAIGSQFKIRPEFQVTLNTAGAAALTTGVPLTDELPLLLVNRPSRVKLEISNHDVYAGTTQSDVTGVEVALYKSDGSGQFTGSPIWTSGGTVTIPGTSSDPYSSGWIDLVDSDIGIDNQVVVMYSTPTSSTIVSSSNVTMGRRSVSSASVNPPPGDLNSIHSHPFTVRARFERDPADIPIVGEGDSIMEGYNANSHAAADGGLEASMLYRLGPEDGYIVDCNGVPNSKCSDWNNPAKAYLHEGETLNGAIAVCNISVNDLSTLSGANDAAKANDYFSRVAVRTAALKAAGVLGVVWTTLSPSAAYAAYNSIRVLVNSGVGDVDGVDAIADIATAVADSGTPSQLASGFNAGDDTHLNAAGEAAAKVEILTAVQSVIASL